MDGIKADDWTPRELRHSFVSLLSDGGVPLEVISRLVGHSGTAVTEEVYRKQIRPVIQTGASRGHGRDLGRRRAAAVDTRGAVVTQIDAHAETGQVGTDIRTYLTCCFGCRGGGI
ncbi:hypothetical protein ACFYU9_21450 [Streptomyces sp. NPDC004327]|uniref:hypothetical protein n=1 Tax=Streptomyces sp. NPDC004327 TaxID=3364699 RepID=UPI0036938BA0